MRLRHPKRSLGKVLRVFLEKTIHFFFVILATRGLISEVGLNFLIGKL